MRPVRLVQEKTLLMYEVSAGLEAVMPPFRFVLGLRFRDSPDVDALQRALDSLIDRHEGLRAAFMISPGLGARARTLRIQSFARTGQFLPGLYVQVSRPGARVHILRENRPVESDSIKGIIEADVRSPFDFSTPPLLRARLIPLKAGETLFTLVVSHLVADAWSIGILYREFVELYRSSVNGQPANLPPPSWSAGQFAEWEYTQLRSGGFDASLGYWQSVWSVFAGDQLRPADFAPQTVASAWSASSLCDIRLDRGESSVIKRSCRRAGVTPYMFFGAALSLTVRELTGRSRLAIASNFANRLFAETFETVGWLNNRHLLGINIEKAETATVVLRTVRTVVSGAIANQRAPLHALWIRSGRSLDTDRDIVNATYDYQHHRRSEASPVCDDISLYPMVEIVQAWHPVDLDVSVIDEGDHFRLLLRFAPHRHSDTGIRGLLESMHRSARALMGVTAVK